MQWDSTLKTSKNFMSIGAINVKNMKSAFVALKGACQSSLSSFHSADTLTYHRKEWIQDPSWEASQNEFAHACSAFERTFDMDPWSVPFWLTYTKTVLKSHNIQHSHTCSIASKEWVRLVQPVFFSCSDLSLLMLSPACGSPCSVGFFLCPDLFPSGVVSSWWVLLAPRLVSFFLCPDLYWCGLQGLSTPRMVSVFPCPDLSLPLPWSLVCSSLSFFFILF